MSKDISSVSSMASSTVAPNSKAQVCRGVHSRQDGSVLITSVAAARFVLRRDDLYPAGFNADLVALLPQRNTSVLFMSGTKHRRQRSKVARFDPGGIFHLRLHLDVWIGIEANGLLGMESATLIRPTISMYERDIFRTVGEKPSHQHCLISVATLSAGSCDRLRQTLLMLAVAYQPFGLTFPHPSRTFRRPLTDAGELHHASRPGIFAVGDVRAGSVKRVASGVGEDSVVVQAIHRFLNPGAA